MRRVGAVGVGVGVLALLLVAVFYTPRPDGAALAEIEELNSRVVIDFARSEDGVVSYLYLGDAVPQQITDAEVSELRTPTSYTTFNGVVEEREDPLLGLTTVIYTQPTFAQDERGEWKVIEHATTTAAAWNSRSVPFMQRIAEWVVHTAYADSATVYSAVGDGFVFHQGNNANYSTSWNNIRNAVTGTTEFYTAGNGFVTTAVSNSGDTSFTVSIYRFFTPFDTSAIPSNASISAATFNMYVTAKTNQDNDGNDYITIATSTQATHTVLATADYDQAGPVDMNSASEMIDAGERKDITSVSTNAYMTFTLNANGRAAIKKSGEASTCSATAGITCIALREGHDAANDMITAPAGQSTTNSLDMRTSEQTGTSQDPYLAVTYTVGASVMQTKLSIKGGGKLKVVGGKLILLPHTSYSQ